MTTLDLSGDGASCTLWLNGAPLYRHDRRVALIGHFKAADAASAGAMVQAALRVLKEKGFDYVIGPMDGDTWHTYRFVIESDGSPPFLMEPHNPAFYPQAFLSSGFAPIARYTSARVSDLKTRPVEHYGARLAEADIRIRPFDPARSDEELKRIYHLSLRSFAGNFLYSPIAEDQFMALYKPTLRALIPDLVLLAEDGAENLQAFIFAIPNHVQHELVIKTYASAYPGLGAYMVETLQREAVKKGYRTMIHALMHDNNVSKRNSNKYGETFRRYALFGREIDK